MSNFYKKTDLKVIKTDGGNVLHGYLEKNLDRIDVKEVYFSTIKKSQFRGWKMHKKMTLNLIVPVGEVKVHLIKVGLKDKLNKHFEILLKTLTLD